MGRDAVICAPSTIVAKKLPDRALPDEIRLVEDARLVGNFCDKIDYPTCENPPLPDIAQRAEFLDRNFAGTLDG